VIDIKHFILPPLGLFILIAVGCVIAWRWRRLGGAIAALSFAALVALSLPFTAGWLMYPLQIYPALDPHALPAGADAIVILSADTQPVAPEYGVDIVGPTTLERVRYGAYLHRRTGKPVLVSGGQVRPRMTPIGIQMQETLTREFNVPVRWAEVRSMTTHENAAFSSEILKREGITRIFLVTHAWHMRRAMAAFRAEGLEPIAAPTRFIRPPLPLAHDFVPNASSLRASYYALHGWLGQLWYYMVGYTHALS
jgi:uncharacterized SAM-binding protein YcdF (DUF218 family)